MRVRRCIRLRALAVQQQTSTNSKKAEA